MELTAEAIDRLVRIVEYIEKTADRGAIDPIERVGCVSEYVHLCGLYPGQPIDSYITSNVTGKLYKIHLPANPEGFLAQLIQPLIMRRDPAWLRTLLTTLNDCLTDQAVHPRVKLSVLNVENALVRQSVITELPVAELTLGRAFCDIRRTLVLDAIDDESKYFTPQDATANQPILNSLYRLYVDTERDLYLRHGLRDAIMPFIEEVLTATRKRRAILAEVLWSVIAANQRALLITAEAMREKLDLYKETLDAEQMAELDRTIEYGGEQGADIRGVTIQLANATFRSTSLGDIDTVIQFVIPLEPRDTEALREGTLAGGRRFAIVFRQIHSSYEDPAITYLSNIGSERIGGLPSTFLSDVNPNAQAGSTLVLVRFDEFLPLDFDVTDEGTITEKPLEDEKALRGGGVLSPQRAGGESTKGALSGSTGAVSNVVQLERPTHRRLQQLPCGLSAEELWRRYRTSQELPADR
jgi:hypothetical protein